MQMSLRTHIDTDILLINKKLVVYYNPIISIFTGTLQKFKENKEAAAGLNI